MAEGHRGQRITQHSCLKGKKILFASGRTPEKKKEFAQMGANFFLLELAEIEKGGKK